jgi:hypothetical protein
MQYVAQIPENIEIWNRNKFYKSFVVPKETFVNISLITICGTTEYISYI